MGFLQDAKKFAQGHKSTVDKAVGEAGKLVQKRTGNKYGGQIRQGEQMIEKELGTEEGGGNQPRGQRGPRRRR